MDFAPGSPAPSLHSTGWVYGTRTEGRACPRRIRAAGGHGARRIGGQWGRRSKMSDILPARVSGLVLRPLSIRGCALFGACVGGPRGASRRGQNDLPIVIVSASKDQVGSGPSCCSAIIDFGDPGADHRAGAACRRMGWASGDSMATVHVGFLPRPARSTTCSATPGEGKGF
ncbi:hypothetical protein C8R45DRAFT_1044724 [Mycena sanguinolenta]|nr:hypothetical protein C8R45DRAFT_1044724 [Mycena sanguinolenta]